MLILRFAATAREVRLRHLNEQACNHNYWAYSKDSSGAVFEGADTNSLRYLRRLPPPLSRLPFPFPYWANLTLSSLLQPTIHRLSVWQCSMLNPRNSCSVNCVNKLCLLVRRYLNVLVSDSQLLQTGRNMQFTPLELFLSGMSFSSSMAPQTAT